MWMTLQMAFLSFTDMMKNKIKANAPKGAKGYAEYEGKIYYFIKSNYGWRQIKDNVIQFDDTGLDLDIKPL